MSLHILVISDNGSFSAYLCGMLSDAGHAAKCVPEGKEAFRAVRLERPDLIVIAAEAAKVAGLAVEQRLHTPQGPRVVPVIVISECLRLEAELLHVFDFIPKPLDPYRLLDDVAAIAGRPAITQPQVALNERQYRELATYMLSSTGLHFEARNHSALKRGVGKRMSALRIESSTDYLAYLERHGEDRHEFQKLLQFLTVGETYFFRYPSHFNALAERLSREPFPAGRIRIWSAGCSTGEEPYSIAITLMETFPDWKERDIKVIATDINHKSIRRAREGVYTPWSLRGTDQRRLERYFDRVGESYLIRDEVKRLVDFSPLNLSSPCSSEISGELRELDAIFCRNVLIYFSLQSAASMVQNFAAALKSSGQLFLGHAESLCQRSPDLQIRRKENSFYYIKSEPSPATVVRPEEREPAQTTPPLPSPDRRLQGPADLLAAAQRLFDAEQFEACRELIEALLIDSPDETGALILKGFILAHEGRFQEAHDTCSRVMGLNDLIPGAYFLKGVLLDASDRLSEAADEYRKALLLDHDFIMPRYHMGRLHLRLGRVTEAAREIRNSIRILAKQDDERTIPYSGGLTRAVCLLQLQSALAKVA